MHRSVLPLVCLGFALIFLIPVPRVSAQVTKATDVAEQPQRNTQESSPPIVIAKKGTPTLDGKLDKIWASVEAVRVERPVEELLQSKRELVATADVKLLWDETHLYALWIVKDSKLSLDHIDDWQQDSVELFLDRNLKRTVFYQYDDAQYRVNYQGKLSGQGEGYRGDDLQAATAKTDAGYVVEMSILIPGGVMEPSHEMGIEFQVNDHRGRQGREAVVKWNHVEDDSWEDTSNFGIVQIQ